MAERHCSSVGGSGWGPGTDASRLVAGLLLAMLPVWGCSGATGGDETNGGGGGGKADGPGDIVLTLDRTWIQPGGKVTLTVDALDEKGRATTDWNLTVNPDQGVRVVPAGGDKVFVSMAQEGIYRITVVNNASGRSDQARLRVDEAGCRVVVDQPARGAALLGADGTRVTVIGHVEDSLDQLHTLQVNGEWIQVDSQGRFETHVTGRRGINRLELVTRDSMGNKFRSLQSFLLASKYLDREAALSANLRMGPAAMDLVMSLVAELLNGNASLGEQPLQLASLLPHPTSVSDSSTVDVQRIDLGKVTGHMAVSSGGVVALSARVGTRTTVTGWAHFLGGTHDYTLTVDWIDMSVRYRVSIRNGAARVEVLDVNVDVGDWDIDLDWAPDFLAGDVGEDVHDAVVKALRENVPDLIAGYLDGVAGEHEVPGYQDLFGTVEPLRWSYGITSITTDNSGLSLGMTVRADAGQGWGVPELPGVPVLGDLVADPGIVRADLGLSTDIQSVNQILWAMWKGGAFSRSFDAAPYLPPLQDMPFQPWSAEVAINGLLPPVAQAGSDGLTLSVGDIQVDLYLSSQLGEINATAYAAADVQVQVRPGRTGYELVVSMQDVYVDIDRVSLAGIDPEAIEAYVEPLIQNMLPRMLKMSAMIPMVSIPLDLIGLKGKIEISNLDFGLSAGIVTLSGSPTRVTD